MPVAADPHAPVVLITGAARRIGAAIARTLHAANCNLALHYHRSDAAIDTLRAELERIRPDSTLGLRANLADTGAANTLVDATVAHFKRLDGLVNNAARYTATPLDTVTAQDWDELMAVNARAPFLLCRAAAGHLRDNGGAIVNLADYYADHPKPDFIAYAASKAALVAITRGLARALAPQVRVNAVAPGAIAWPEGPTDKAGQEAVLRETFLNRVGTPEDIATTVRWLLFEAPFVTGQVIHVDGGRDGSQAPRRAPRP